MPRSQQQKKTCWTRNKQEPLRSSLGWRKHPNWSERKCLSPETKARVDTRWTWSAPEQRRHEERVVYETLNRMGESDKIGAVMQAMARSRQNVGGHHFSSTSKSKRRHLRKRSGSRKSRARKRSGSRKSRAHKRSGSRKSRARKRSGSRKSRKSHAHKRSVSRKSRVRKSRRSRRSRKRSVSRKSHGHKRDTNTQNSKKTSICGCIGIRCLSELPCTQGWEYDKKNPMNKQIQKQIQ